MPQVPDFIGQRQQAFQPLEATLQNTQQRSLDTFKEVQAVKEAREKWAINNVIQLYQGADPDLQDSIKQGIVANPESQKLFQKYAPGMMNTILQRTKPTTEERLKQENQMIPQKAANDLLRSRLDFQNKATLEESPEKRSFDLNRMKNEAILPAIVSSDEDVQQAREFQMYKDNEMLLKKEQDTNYQDAVSQRAQNEAEAFLNSAATRGQASRTFHDYADLEETEDGQHMTRAQAKYLGIKLKPKKTDDEGYTVSKGRAEDEFLISRDDFRNWDASQVDKKSVNYRGARRSKANKVIESYLKFQSSLGEEEHQKAMESFKQISEYIENPIVDKKTGTHFRDTEEGKSLYQAAMNADADGSFPLAEMIRFIEPGKDNSVEDNVAKSWLENFLDNSSYVPDWKK